MHLFAIADTHLSLRTNKPMDIFQGWSDYVQRLETNWRRLVTDEDVVVIPGDISWEMDLQNCKQDFAFLNSLPGTKILMKGNHDYWWTTKRKMDAFIEENGFSTLKILFNNAYLVDGYSVCGTRGWFLENDTPEDIKVLNREVGRLKASLEAGKQLGGELAAFLHYPPYYRGIVCREIMDVLKEYGVKKCYYGHIHGRQNFRLAFEGEFEGIDFRLISCDRVEFTPVLVR